MYNTKILRLRLVSEGSVTKSRIILIDWQITSRQNLLDRIKLVTIKVSESHCLRLGSCGWGKISGNVGVREGVRRGGWEASNVIEKRERREYTNPLCQVEMTTGSSLRFELLRAGLRGPGAAYLIWWITHPLEPLEEICCCVYADGVALQLCRLGHQLSIYLGSSVFCQFYTINSTFSFLCCCPSAPQWHSRDLSFPRNISWENYIFLLQ